MTTKKRVLLVDLDDSRRSTRVALLANRGYEVDVRADYLAAEELGGESTYDLLIVALHKGPKDAAVYADRVAQKTPSLPVLLLTDMGVYVPAGILSRHIGTGDPAALLRQVAVMLTGSDKVKELLFTEEE
jgi:DNA-binding NtrC family response regulator